MTTTYQNQATSPAGSEIIASGFPFEIRPLQWLQENMLKENAQSHSHNYFEIVWVIRGSGTFWVDLEQHAIHDRQVFCVKPGLMHRLRLEGEVEGYIFSFTESFLSTGEQEFDLTYQSGLFQAFALSSGIFIQQEMMSDMAEIADKMMKEFDNLYLFRTQMLRRYIKIFLIYLSRHCDGMTFRPVSLTRNIELVQKFMSLLDKNFKQMRTVMEYASSLAVTPNYLNVIVKKSTGYSAGHHIKQRIALEAKRQATFSDVCMKEIAYSLGFSDMAHFSKFFKNTTGMNFSEFKRERCVIALA